MCEGQFVPDRQARPIGGTLADHHLEGGLGVGKPTLENDQTGWIVAALPQRQRTLDGSRRIAPDLIAETDTVLQGVKAFEVA